ncbi:triple functional domain protein-like isoform X1 [Corythoichthys intestinalis]|uniref:triple functional domain protein-like isoform X1 n=1 Tax=Corythoichthys intestinalis TaxID=161448 RepID=UPI0025A62DDA|nr:triple functional domain protein-like isoform X1 [Corythoichthys intestinalis]
MEHLTSELTSFVEWLGEYPPELTAGSLEGQGSAIGKTTSNDTDLEKDNAGSTTTNWLQLLPKTHGKRQVVIASLAFQKTWAQVCRLLESLEEDYKRMEDWCCPTGKPDSSAQLDHVTFMSSKHLEQKEFFLKACTLTKGIAEIFYQYVERNGDTMGRLGHDQEEHVTGILTDLCERENRLLCLWNIRKQQLDQCLQYLTFERRAIQAQKRIQDMGELYLSMNYSTGSGIGFRQELLKEKENINIISKKIEECVKLLIQLADGYCAKGHSHAGKIKKSVLAVDRCYQDLNRRMEKHRSSLEKLTGAKYLAAHYTREKNHEGNDTLHGDGMMPRSCRTLKGGLKLEYKGKGPSWQKWLNKSVWWPNHN